MCYPNDLISKLIFADVQQMITDSDSANEGTYFMDENGQYYYQSNPSENPVLVSSKLSECASMCVLFTLKLISNWCCHVVS